MARALEQAACTDFGGVTISQVVMPKSILLGEHCLAEPA